MSFFKSLYFFSNKDLDLIEIKRLDLSKDAPISSIYKWLAIPKRSNKVLELDFVSMDKGQSHETRVFKEGSFKFKEKEGQLTLLGFHFNLNKQNADDIPEELKQKTADFLNRKIDQFNSQLFSFRDLRPSDISYIENWIFDKEVIKFSLTAFHRITTSMEAKSWFYATLINPKGLNFGIIDPETSELIGYCGLSSINEIDQNAEYFVIIGNKKYWGKGIGSEVTKAIVKIGFQDLKLNRVFLTASSDNIGALKAYERAGFIFEGRMREAFYRDYKHSDKIIMGILRSEYTAP